MKLANTETTIFKEWAAPKIKSGLILLLLISLWRLGKGSRDSLDYISLVLGVVGMAWFIIDIIKNRSR